MVHPSNPGVCSRRKMRAPPSTSGSISKSSSQTPRSRRFFGSRVTKRSVGSRMCPSAEMTSCFSVMVVPFLRGDARSIVGARTYPVRAVLWPPILDQPVGTDNAAKAVERWGRPGGDEGMSKRWKQRPPGSTWGDWGDDDELGRINLLTQEKVLQGVREVAAGVSFCLSLPLDYPGGSALNQRRSPPVLRPTEDLDHKPDTFYNVIARESLNPTYIDVWSDDMVTLWLQYSTQWDALAHQGAEFDANGDGSAEPVYYNGFRAGADIIGPRADAKED